MLAIVFFGGGSLPLVRTSLLSTPSNGASSASPVTPRLACLFYIKHLRWQHMPLLGLHDSGLNKYIG